MRSCDRISNSRPATYLYTRLREICGEDERRRVSPRRCPSISGAGIMVLQRKGYQLAQLCTTQIRRNYGVTAVALQKLDPIQKLFVDKLREYTQKSKSAGTLLFEASPEIEKELNDNLAKAETQYGGGKGVDMTKLPEFKFTDPPLDSINLSEK